MEMKRTMMMKIFFKNTFKEYEAFQRIELEKFRLKEKLDNIVKYLVDQNMKSCDETAGENNHENTEIRVIDRNLGNISSVTVQESDTTEECESSFDKHDNRYKYEWLKHSSGLATKIINKMGYKGKGLGKNEDGIEEAIQVDETKFNTEFTKTTEKKLLSHPALC